MHVCQAVLKLRPQTLQPGKFPNASIKPQALHEWHCVGTVTHANTLQLLPETPHGCSRAELGHIAKRVNTCVLVQPSHFKKHCYVTQLVSTYHACHAFESGWMGVRTGYPGHLLLSVWQRHLAAMYTAKSTEITLDKISLSPTSDRATAAYRAERVNTETQH